MNLLLTTEQRNYLNRKMETGTYASESDVIRDALRLMEDRDVMQEKKLEVLRCEIQKGIDSIDRGEGRPLDIEAIKARGRAMLKRKSPNA